MPRAANTINQRQRRASLGDFEQLLGLDGVAPLSVEDVPDGAEAVLYLRVSTQRQMNTAIDIDEDGNSIATQREMCTKRCSRMKTPIASEFVEPGNSAQSIAKRPVFRQLLRYVEDNPRVGYVIIYMRSRAFRNYTDAAIAKRILAAMGVKLVSAKEEFGEGYMADAMEAITDIMNEVQVRQSGEDIRNKMLHKAQNGGTTGRAKLGYLNTRKDIDGRLVNTIDTDPVRAPLVRWAFEQYATGEYSLARLQREMADQGLVTRRTATWAEKPVSRSQLGVILRDPYYLGMVTFKGQVFPGRHEALVSPELFERVQRVIDSRMRRSQRDVVHSHFLRGLMHCGRCHKAGRTSQLVYSQPANHAGQAYQYYFCTGRREHDCGLRHLRVADVEDAVQREVASLRLTPEEAAAMREQTTTQLKQRLATERDTHARLRQELRALDVKEERLLDLAAEASLSSGRLRQRLSDLQIRRAALQRQLDHTDDHLRKQTDTMLAYISLLERPGEFYAAATDEVKRKLLAAFYTDIWLDDDGTATCSAPQPRGIVTYIRDTASHAVHAKTDHTGPDDTAPEHARGAGSDPSASRASNLGQYPQSICSNESNLGSGDRI